MTVPLCVSTWNRNVETDGRPTGRTVFVNYCFVRVSPIGSGRSGDF